MLIETRGGFDFSGADCIGWMRDVATGVGLTLNATFSARDSVPTAHCAIPMSHACDGVCKRFLAGDLVICSIEEKGCGRRRTSNSMGGNT
jgi:hypothetical protein